MFAQVRAFSSLTRVVQAPVPSAKAFSTINSAINSELSEESGGKTKIHKETLDLLEKTVMKEKTRPVTDASQRYQKIHQEGDIYHPEDLNDTRYRESLRKRRGRPVPPTEDPFEVLGLDPLHEYKNFRLLTHFVSDMGKILPREQTGVSAKNQRKLAKAIKRARAMGLMSSTSNQYDFRV